jgi:hypothetical protein
VYKGRVIENGYVNPKGTVHLCTGNGGPPSASKCTCQDNQECTTCVGDPYSYTRLTLFNATDLLWEQISNADNSIIDSWRMHQDTHGKFPIPPPAPPPANPTPAPPPAGTSWECHAKVLMEGCNLRDTDLTKPPFHTKAATLETCEQMCNGAKGCVAVNWHAGGVNTCHLLTGTAPSRAAYAKCLRNQTAPDIYSACLRVPV